MTLELILILQLAPYELTDQIQHGGFLSLACVVSAVARLHQALVASSPGLVGSDLSLMACWLLSAAMSLSSLQLSHPTPATTLEALIGPLTKSFYRPLPLRLAPLQFCSSMVGAGPSSVCRYPTV